MGPSAPFTADGLLVDSPHASPFQMKEPNYTIGPLPRITQCIRMPLTMEPAPLGSG